MELAKAATIKFDKSYRGLSESLIGEFVQL
jgi:hypothetical protein